MEPGQAQGFYRYWKADGMIQGDDRMTSEDVAIAVADLVDSPLHVPRIDLMPDYGNSVQP